jgi:hydrogenase maturation protein HypF
MLILDPRPAIRRILELVSRGVSVGELAGAFHGGFCTALAQAAAALCERQGLRTVALSGGTFQNARVLCGTADRLEESGLRVLYPRAVPPGDGGLALGQAVVAAAVLREEG